MVRLKEADTEELRMKRERSFNSTMVRLKGEAGLNPALSDMFQFHYGTIKRLHKSKFLF